VRDLPQYQGELRTLLEPLSDVTLREFARQVAREEETRSLGLAGVDWDAVLAELVGALECRAGEKNRNTTIDIAAQRGAALVAGNDFREARRVLEDVLALAEGGHERLGWILTSLAQLEFAEEHWIRSGVWLARAERELIEGRVISLLDFETWLHSLQGDYWVQIGMPELATRWVERLWSESAQSTDPAQQWKAFEVYVNLLLVSNDYRGVRALERALADNGWLAAWGPQDQDRARMRFALAGVEQGVSDERENAAARAALEEVLAAGRLPDAERTWTLVHLGLAALDGGDVDRAASAAAELREVLAELETLDVTRPENTVAPRLIALEGLVALARHARGSAAPGELMRCLEAAGQAWVSLRAGWADVPTRDGGIGYLFLSQRQILIEALIGLELAVLGEEQGALAALQWLVEAQQESTLARRLAAPAATFAETRACLLDGRTGLVAWIPLRGRSFALAADGQRARAFVLPAVDVLEARARDASDALKSALESDHEAAHSGLGVGLEAAALAFLPEALAQWIEPLDGLYLMGLDDAGYVPFEMLPEPREGSQGARRDLARLPSLPVGLVLRERSERDASAGARAVACIADRTDAERARAHGVEDLRLGSSDAGEFLDALGTEDNVRLRGGEATWGALVRALDADADVLHVVAHGIRRVHERPPGILLAGADESAEVFAEQVESLRGPRLVLLSVCGAARSRLRRGDGGRSDLAAAFFVAGSAAVAASPSDLDLGPTLRTGALVHGELARGATLASALREARRAVSEPEQRLGRDWIAAHALTAAGEGLRARLVSSPRAAPPGVGERGRWWTLAIAAGGVAALAIAVRRRRAA
jgi:hypothetical protein